MANDRTKIKREFVKWLKERSDSEREDAVAREVLPAVDVDLSDVFENVRSGSDYARYYKVEKKDGPFIPKGGT